MKNLIFLFFVCVAICYSQEQIEPWERLGLSKTEWIMIEENHMSMSQVEDLLKAGISISEYFKKPWIELNMTEQRWVEKKRSGMSSYDIEIEAKAKNAEWETEMKSGFRSEMSGVSENAESFSALIPGFQQFKSGSVAKGVIMSSIALGAVTWCTAGSISNKRFYSLPIFAVLVPDVIWSYVDYKISKRHKNQ
jgi:hypothetical protein